MNHKAINKAMKHLNNGEVIGVYTDTIMGLATLPQYQDKIYQLKKRDYHKKIIYLISDVTMIPNLSKTQQCELKALWPGAISIIINDQGYRIPDNPLLCALIKQIKQPLAVSSANISGLKPVGNKRSFHNYFPQIYLFNNKTKMTKQASYIFVYNNNINNMIQLR